MPSGQAHKGRAMSVVPAATSVDGRWISAAEYAEYVELRSRDRRRARRRRSRADNPFGAGQRMVSMLSSMLPRLAEHVAMGSVSGAQVGRLTQDLGAISDAAVRRLREQGYSWSEVGDCFGVSKQGAQQRWSRDRGIG